MPFHTKKAIIVGASTGIGKALAQAFATQGAELGLAARRLPLLEEIQSELNCTCHIVPMDIARPTAAMEQLNRLIQALGGLDIMIINAGVRIASPHIDFVHERQMIDVNVRGFAAMADAAFNYFIEQGHGHIVGISSVAALIPSHHAPAYNASKAFVSTYLQGIRLHAEKLRLPILITDVKPGYVDTPLLSRRNHFWMATPAKAAAQILRAVARRRQHVYVTKRWRLAAWLLKAAPRALLKYFA